MNNRKTIIISATILILIIVAAWYFFLKSWDYKVFFTVKAHPSVVYTKVKDFDEWNGKKIDRENISYSNPNPWKELNKTITIKDTTYNFEWHFKQKNDSLTRVVVGISDKQRTLQNRWQILLQKSPFGKCVKRNTRILKDKINEQVGSFNYNYIGTGSLEQRTCVYISTKSTIRDKANEMIRNVILLNQFVKANELELSGDPFVIVKDWNPKSDIIHFDFCFPVLHPERMSKVNGIKLKKVSMEKALKGEFYGNYSQSDMAWYQLFEQTQKNNQEITGRIIEVFNNDPHGGGNELEWKADIYLELGN